jgi:hypothetical protein
VIVSAVTITHVSQAPLVLNFHDAQSPIFLLLGIIMREDAVECDHDAIRLDAI